MYFHSHKIIPTSNKLKTTNQQNILFGGPTFWFPPTNNSYFKHRLILFPLLFWERNDTMGE